MKHLPSPALPQRGRLLAALVALLVLGGLVAPALPQIGAEPAAAAACPCSIFSGTAVPANPAENDPAAVELGVKFRADVAGFVTAVRFYKGTGNGGTHTGSLWATNGTRLQRGLVASMNCLRIGAA